MCYSFLKKYNSKVALFKLKGCSLREQLGTPQLGIGDRLLRNACINVLNRILKTLTKKTLNLKKNTRI